MSNDEFYNANAYIPWICGNLVLLHRWEINSTNDNPFWDAREPSSSWIWIWKTNTNTRRKKKWKIHDSDILVFAVSEVFDNCNWHSSPQSDVEFDIGNGVRTNFIYFESRTQSLGWHNASHRIRIRQRNWTKFPIGFSFVCRVREHTTDILWYWYRGIARMLLNLWQRHADTFG